MNSIKIRYAADKDRCAWNDFVYNHKDSTYSHVFEWREIIGRTYGLKSNYLIFYIGDEIIGVLPLIYIPSIIGMGSWVSVPFTNYGGALFKGAYVEEINLQDVAKKFKLNDNNIKLRTISKPNANGFKGPVTQILPLQNEEEMWSNFKGEIRTSTRKAIKSGLVIRNSNDYLNIFYRDVYVPCIHNLGTPHHSIEYFNWLFKLIPDRVGLLTVWEDENIVGGIIYILHNSYFSILVSNSKREYNRDRPNNLLIWESIKIAIGTRKTQFDFGRSNQRSGTYNFKKRWGAIDHPIITQTISKDYSLTNADDINYNSLYYRTAATVWKKIPKPIIRITGPILRKYIP